MSTTAGMSYSYTLPQTYRGTTTNSISCYKTLDHYGPCQGGTIISPSPMSTIPSIFYNVKPHAMPNNVIPTNKLNSIAYDYGALPDSNNLKGCGNCSPYRSLDQTIYTVGGLENSPSFRLGFNDITNNNNTNNFNNTNIYKRQTEPIGNNYFQ